MVEDSAEELEDLVHFSVSELPSRGYGVMEEIRRQGKLCDVTLKVPWSGRWLAEGKGTEREEKGGGQGKSGPADCGWRKVRGEQSSRAKLRRGLRPSWESKGDSHWKERLRGVPLTP